MKKQHAMTLRMIESRLEAWADTSEMLAKHESSENLSQAHLNAALNYRILIRALREMREDEAETEQEKTRYILKMPRLKKRDEAPKQCPAVGNEWEFECTYACSHFCSYAATPVMKEAIAKNFPTCAHSKAL